MSAFDKAFEVVIGHEGGFSNERADPGNWTGGAVGKGTRNGTNFGISAAAYPDVDIASLTPEQAAAIYRRDYWARIRGDDLPAEVALLVFDAAVNNGPGQAIRWLQQAAGAMPDGVLGEGTLAAVGHAVEEQGVEPVSAEFQARRLVFMAALPSWRIFGPGWARRLCLLPYQAMQLAGNWPANQKAPS